MITVTEPSDVSGELVAAIGRLVGQLSSTAPAPTRAELEWIVASPATTLIVAHTAAGGDAAASGTGGAPEAPIVGMLTLAVFRIPTGVRAWIEDVVVDEAARGRGVGAALSQRAVELATAAGARTVELTSRPSREAANRLYRRLGFQPRDTNVYRFTAAPGASRDGHA
ncbi:MAG TPA: GNAT family N-acetyltransferase [Acidimicrobiales bacterium]|nr:GNAT family N-acetyltransferase [Acidimicrobiales bacterium]